MFEYSIRVHTDVNDLALDPTQTDQGSTSLWGGPGITNDNALPLLLTIRVDDIGEDIAVYSRSNIGTGKPTSYGSLSAAGVYTIPLDGVHNVYARCTDPKLATQVRCSLSVRPLFQAASAPRE